MTLGVRRNKQLYDKEWASRNQGKIKIYRKRAKAKRKEKDSSYNQTWRSKNPDYYRNYLYKRNYGITLEVVNAMVLDQNGLCAICGNPFKSVTDMHVDHCHETNLVRGLLCANCNKALGLFHDREENLTKAVAYLRKSRDV